jgi:hypothetical protein
MKTKYVKVLSMNNHMALALYEFKDLEKQLEEDLTISQKE